MTIIEKWKDLNAFQARYPAISGAIWFSVIACAALFLIPRHIVEVPVFVAGVLFFGYAAVASLAKYEAALQDRIGAGELSLVWNVRINGIDVGTLLDSDYAQIRKNVFFDVRTYVAQIMNAGNAMARVVVWLFVLLPALIFWAGLAGFLLSPESFAATAAEIQKLKPSDMGWSLLTFLSLYLVLLLAMLPFWPTARRSIGYINRFETAINDKIRLHAGCAAEGDISVYRIEQGDVVLPNELHYIRTGNFY